MKFLFVTMVMFCSFVSARDIDVECPEMRSLEYQASPFFPTFGLCPDDTADFCTTYGAVGSFGSYVRNYEAKPTDANRRELIQTFNYLREAYGLPMVCTLDEIDHQWVHQVTDELQDQNFKLVISLLALGGTVLLCLWAYDYYQAHHVKAH